MPAPIEKNAWVKALRIVVGSLNLLASHFSKNV